MFIAKTKQLGVLLEVQAVLAAQVGHSEDLQRNTDVEGNEKAKKAASSNQTASAGANLQPP